MIDGLKNVSKHFRMVDVMNNKLGQDGVNKLSNALVSRGMSCMLTS